MRLLAIGHSHLYSIKRGYASNEREGIEAHFVQLLNPEFQPTFIEDGEQLNHDIVEAIRAANLTPADAVALFLHGEHGYFISLFEKFERITTYNAPKEADVSGRRYVPYNLIKARIEDGMGPYKKLLFEVLKQVEGKVIVVQVPPPVPEGYIKEHPIRFEKEVAEFAISPSWVRCAFWEAYSDVLRGLARSEGLEYLPIPDDVRRSDGMLKDELCGGDIMHANYLYGQLVIDDLCRKLVASDG